MFAAQTEAVEQSRYKAHLAEIKYGLLSHRLLLCTTPTETEAPLFTDANVSSPYQSRQRFDHIFVNGSYNIMNTTMERKPEIYSAWAPYADDSYMNSLTPLPIGRISCGMVYQKVFGQVCHHLACPGRISKLFTFRPVWNPPFAGRQRRG